MEWKIVLGVTGGLGLFIYGMYLVSDSLRKLSLNVMKMMLEKLTANSIKSTLVGLVVTAIIQSSSATSVILIGFLNAGLLPLAAALAIMLGAHVGTTVTAQLVAFKLTAIAPVMVFVGVVVFLVSKKDKNKYKGLALLGFGMLFMGLALMSAAVKPLVGNDTARDMFIKFGREPLLGVLTGLLVTLVLQSSSTVSGMIIAFATAGLLDLPSSIYLIFGTNIGTGITAIIASIGGGRSSKRLAIGNILSTAIGAGIALVLAPLYIAYIPLTSDDIARQVANTHTIFNLFNTLLFLPLIPFLVSAMNKILPGQDYEKKSVRHLDDNLLPTPSLALKAVIKELIVMLDICHGMLEKARQCTRTYNHKLRNEISIDEESVDEMQKNITEYLTVLTKHELSDKHRHLIPAILHSVNDLEKVGDYCESIIKQAHRAFEYNLLFSEDALTELEKLFYKTDILIRHTRRAIEYNDHNAASITLTVEKEIDELIAQYKLNHVMRLGQGDCVSNAGLVFSDILTDLERLNDHLCNITKGILHIGKR